MNQLDTEWEQRVRQARERASASGRSDVAEYLTLRATNDLARTTGIEWLFEAFTALAGEANRAGGGVTLAREEGHRFQFGNSTMVGARLTLRVGVRALTIEGGWPRAPRDGIVRGGGLANACVRHFGDRAASDDLLLMQRTNGAPQWTVLETNGARTPLSEDRLRHHIEKLLHPR